MGILSDPESLKIIGMLSIYFVAASACICWLFDRWDAYDRKRWSQRCGR